MIAIAGAVRSRSCWSRPTPWRRRSASGPTSWPSSRRSLSATTRVLRLVLVESCLIAIGGRDRRWRCLADRLLHRPPDRRDDSPLYLPERDIAIGAVIIVVWARNRAVAGPPASRLRIVDALRKG